MNPKPTKEKSMPLDKNQTTLVTGAAGFIGFHLCNKLLENGNRVIGLDNLNPYYDVSLKKARLERLKSYEAFFFSKAEIEDLPQLKKIFRDQSIDRICRVIWKDF
jgi:UDP-glucuronate 4-epimerase